MPGKPRDVDIESLNSTCIDTSWREPDFDGGVINDYMVMVYGNHKLLARNNGN